MPTALVNGTKLYYIRTGKGADVVLVHGLASNVAFWYSGTILPLRHQYRVTAYDLRGHGYSGMPHSGYTHKHMAEDLLGLADCLKLGRFHLVGHSFGGLVSLSFALRHPKRLRSLTLADVPISGISPDRPSWWHGLLETLRDLGITVRENEPYPELQILEELARPQVRSLIQGRMRIFTHLPYYWGRGSKRTAKRWLELLNTTTAREDIRLREISAEELRRIELPTLMIYGSESMWRSSGKILRECLPNLNTVYVENAGHCHPWEKPERFLQNWRRFISAIDARGQYLGRDRRRHKRFKLRFPLSLREIGDTSYRAATLDVSRGGLLIESSRQLRMDREVEITAILNEDDQRIVSRGRVVWMEREETGSDYRFGIELFDGGQAWENLLAE
ncbi:MAG: alpha/beta fold hydrolase [Proteobacteria bacterium]|nr:alpha/beta fold hydrolase [Pseudomonadota bacterium]